MMGLLGVGVVVGVCRLTACHLVHLSAHPLTIMTLFTPNLRRSLSSHRQPEVGRNVDRRSWVHFIAPVSSLITTHTKYLITLPIFDSHPGQMPGLLGPLGLPDL